MLIGVAASIMSISWAAWPCDRDSREHHQQQLSRLALLIGVAASIMNIRRVGAEGANMPGAAAYLRSGPRLRIVSIRWAVSSFDQTPDSIRIVSTSVKLLNCLLMRSS